MDNVAIVGGGIGGLAAALALIRRGIDVDVYEQAPELRELGAGVQISANGTRVLHALGLKEALEKVQVLPAGKAIRLWNTGQSWKLFDLGLESVECYGFPYITIHRGDLHGVIAQAVLQAKPGAIHLSRKCVGLSQTSDHVELRFETGAPVKAKLVVGADGVQSVLREIEAGTRSIGMTPRQAMMPQNSGFAAPNRFSRTAECTPSAPTTSFAVIGAAPSKRNSTWPGVCVSPVHLRFR